MRVLFLTLYPENAASARYRVHQFLPYLRSRGIDCTVRSAVSPAAYARFTGPNRTARAAWYHLHETPRRIAQMLDAGSYDVVFVQKALMSASLRGLDRLLRNRARKVIYDIDDAVFLAAPHNLRGPWRRIEDPSQIARIIANADCVLAGNPWLADRSGTRANLWPTVVDTDRFTPGVYSEDTFRVGWIGGPSTTPALAECGNAFEGIEVRLIGADTAAVPFKYANTRPWHYETEVDEIQNFSVGIMPLAKNDWALGKCALKALQYMACGVPCVATPYGFIKEIIRHGENGIFADSPEEWRAAVDLLGDPLMRAKIGAAGRATAVDRFSLHKAAPAFLAHLESVA